MTAPARRRNGPGEAQPTLPLPYPRPTEEPAPPPPQTAPRWTAYAPDGRGWCVAVRAVADGEITVDQDAAGYAVRRWVRAPGGVLRHDPETLRRAPSFEAAVALALE